MPDARPHADLDLRLVRYFIAVARHRHFGRAAAELLVAQPSLSRQIRRLEQQLGTPLLDRVADGARLTAAGRTFLPRADGKALVATGEFRAAPGLRVVVQLVPAPGAARAQARFAPSDPPR